MNDPRPVRLSHDDYDMYVAARQERDALAARLAEATSFGVECQKSLEEARARLAEAERDAARYRWLRDRAWPFEFKGNNPEDADAAIDAEIAAGRVGP